MTLYKRATPPQARILNIIEGAIKNVADKSGREFDLRYARSVAKRACGTLTAQWPEVLATVVPPPGWESKAQLSDAMIPTTICQGTPRSEPSHPAKRAKAGRSQFTRPSPLRLLERDIARQMRDIKNSGNVERAAAFIDILRLISALRNKEG